MKTLHAVSPKMGQNSLSHIWLGRLAIGYKSRLGFCLAQFQLEAGLHRFALEKVLRRMRDEEHL